jgi:pilus assembly protein CpaB
VEVLSAGQNFQKDTEGKPVSVQVVNLLVTPEQAEMLSLASSQTTIQLVLRNPLDTQIAKTPGTAVVQLFRSDMAFPKDEKLGQPVMARPTPRPARLVPLPSKPRVVEVILGIKRAEMQFTPAVVEVKP